jgi:hypothetical protein
MFLYGLIEHPRPTVININWTDERGEEKKKEAYVCKSLCKNINQY